MPPPAPEPRRERGVVIVYLAFFIFIFLGFMGLAIDATKLVATRTQLQRAADAAALAGVSAIDLETGSIIADTAVARAQETASFNRAFADGPTAILVDPADVEFPQPLQVKVTVRRQLGNGGSIITYVARAIGVTDLEMTADATAEADTAAMPCDGLVPMAPVEPPDSGWFDPDCSKTYELKVGSGEGEQGNYQLIDYPPCNEGPCQGLNGGAAIRCYAEHGYGCCLGEGQEFTLTEPGNKVGPFRQGMQARFDADTDRREGICYDDYTGDGHRVVPLPVIETFDVNGKKFVRIVKFSSFFIKERPPGNGTLTGQFVHDSVPGDGGGGGGGTLYVLRLIE